MTSEKPQSVKTCKQCGVAEATVTKFPPDEKPIRLCAKCADLDKFYPPKDDPK